jgi:predicted dehydrogenase
VSPVTAPRSDDPIRVSLVGVVFGARTLLPALLATPGVEVVAVCAAHQDRADAVAREHGIPVATDDYRRAIEHEGVDLVCLCVPPRLHAEMIDRALDAGRHVFSTKPLTTDLADAVARRDRAEALGVVTAMEYCFRYLPVRRYVRSLVRDGFLGELRFVSATVFGDFATQPDHELYHWKWVSSRAEGGGILGASLALHHLDLFRYTFGELHETWGTAATLIREKPMLGADESAAGPSTKPVDSEDAVVVQGLLDSGAPFNLAVTWSVHHPSGERLEVYGSDGTLVVEPTGRLLGARADDTELRELVPPDEFALPETALGPADEAAVVPSSPLYVALVDDVLRAVRGANPDPLFATFDDGVRLMEIAGPILERFDARATSR